MNENDLVTKYAECSDEQIYSLYFQNTSDEVKEQMVRLLVLRRMPFYIKAGEIDAQEKLPGSKGDGCVLTLFRIFCKKKH